MQHYSIWKNNYFYILLVWTLAIFLSAIWLHTHLLFNWDISWLMHAGRRLLQGGNYYQDFFEVNPPMSIYAYLPAVILSKLFNLSLMLSAQVYLFTLVAVSLSICFYLLISYYPPNSSQPYWLTGILVALFLITPGFDFGQRDYLSCLLTLPYACLAAVRDRQITNPLLLVIGIGLLAGIGFSIKPFYVINFGLIELYLALRQKCYLSWLRLETLIVLAIILLYLGSIFIFTPQYIYQVLPLVDSYYYKVYGVDSFLNLLNIYPIFFWLGTLILHYLLRKNITQSNLYNLIEISTLGFVIAYFLQQTIWTYHILPFMLTSSFLLGGLLGQYFLNSKHIKAQRGILIIIISSVLLAYLYQATIKNLHDWNKLTKSTPINNYTQIIKTYAKDQPIYFLTDKVYPTYPIVDYANTDNVSRFSCLWILFGLTTLHPITPTEQTIFLREKNFFIQAVLVDLSRWQPALVFVKFKLGPTDNIKDRCLFLQFLLADPDFAKIWQHYRYVTTIHNYHVYKKVTPYKNEGDGEY